MGTNVKHASKIPAIICLVAFVLLAFSGNVHTHDASPVRGAAYVAHNEHCTACDLFYSGAAQAVFSATHILFIGNSTSPTPGEPTAGPSLAESIKHASRAPPPA